MTDSKPTINELGRDLLTLSRFKVIQTIAQPLVFFVLYFVFAFHGYWVLAVLSTIAMSFTTYGSTSHDLVHMNLKINPKLNDFLLSFIELISLRSGHAYRQSHLNHHKIFPHEEDIEGQASGMSFFRSLLEGVIFQFKIYFWALSKTSGRIRNIILLEGLLILIIISAGIWSMKYNYVFIVYIGLIIAGSWIIPFITSYLVHNPKGKDELHQTKLFRGKFYSIIALDHLYHLEHHMYPMVPHKNWVKLAQRLDPYFEKKNIKPLK
ncbi:fatty acid desaturase family protein [Mangrovivirga cuniculi]|uniref:Fatty acid desaturase n=1 Tax=Mangrovivirga cuniculi TaxID=2715131 RepID=A0A4D7JJ73_9BACT|nr:fatty acid desaturase [Mangrovivirga cuniculi]QCK15641.1 fatty acid desaturase [Mangrovivirga cuniculi]